VVCLDCGKHFAYDAKQMVLGKRLEDAQTIADVAAEAVPPPEPRPSKPAGGKLKYALCAFLPVAVLLGSILKTRKPPQQEPAPGLTPGAPR
jgi:hypothetical protein